MSNLLAAAKELEKIEASLWRIRSEHPGLFHDFWDGISERFGSDNEDDGDSMGNVNND